MYPTFYDELEKIAASSRALWSLIGGLQGGFVGSGLGAGIGAVSGSGHGSEEIKHRANVGMLLGGLVGAGLGGYGGQAVARNANKLREFGSIPEDWVANTVRSVNKAAKGGQSKIVPTKPALGKVLKFDPSTVEPKLLEPQKLDIHKLNPSDIVELPPLVPKNDGKIIELKSPKK